MTPPLKPHHATLLREGTTRGARSEAVASVTLAMVNAGWSWADYLDAFTDPTHRLGDYFRTRSDGRAIHNDSQRRRLGREWDSAQRKATRDPAVADRTEARQRIGELIAARDSTPWASRAALTRLAVLTALHRLGTELGSLHVRVSTRQLSEAARCGRATGMRAVDDLVGLGWLRVIEPASSTRGAVLELRGPVHRWTSPSPIHGVGTTGPSVDLDSDAWEVLSRPARRVFALLHPTEPRTPAELMASPAAPSRASVYGSLKRLAQHGLAVQHEDGGWTRDEAALEAIAPEGKARADARRLRHDLDRAGYLAATGKNTLSHRTADTERPSHAEPAEPAHHVERPAPGLRVPVVLQAAGLPHLRDARPRREPDHVPLVPCPAAADRRRPVLADAG